MLFNTPAPELRPFYASGSLGLQAAPYIPLTTGLSRPAVYAAINGESGPKLSTLLSLFTALGIKTVVEPQEAAV